MKTLEELKEFYHQSLVPSLTDLEVVRKKVMYKLIVVNCIFICISLVGIFILINIEKSSFYYTANLMVTFIIFIIPIWILIISRIRSNFKTEFKHKIINAIIKFINENFRYIPSGKTDKMEQLFIQSKLFKKSKSIGSFESEDYVKGEIGMTRFEFSEVHAKSKYKSNGHRYTIFKGLFFVVVPNKNFNGELFILPDISEKYLGQFGTMLQSLHRTRGEVIKLEDPDFEKLFVVYGSNQIEARYILSPDLTKKIYDFRIKTGKPLYISFVNSKVFIAIPYKKNLLEPKIFRTLLDFNKIQEYFEDLQFVIGIVEDLNFSINQ